MFIYEYFEGTRDHGVTDGQLEVDGETDGVVDMEDGAGAEEDGAGEQEAKLTKLEDTFNNES